jgi:hypothetical protein
LLGSTIVIGLFALRLGIPLIVTAAVVYMLHRLGAKWQAEIKA